MSTDVPSCDQLREIARELAANGIVMSLARVHGPVLELLERGGVVEIIGRDRVFRVLLEAVAEHTTRTGRQVDSGVIAERTAAELRDLVGLLPPDSGDSTRLERAIEVLDLDGMEHPRIDLVEGELLRPLLSRCHCENGV